MSINKEDADSKRQELYGISQKMEHEELRPNVSWVICNLWKQSIFEP